MADCERSTNFLPPAEGPESLGNSSSRSVIGIAALTRIFLVAVMTLELTGCCCFQSKLGSGMIADRLFAQYRECVWARRAYNLEYGNSNRKFGDHFRKGFVEGYCGVCTGGDGYVPAMPPEEYWGFEYQSDNGSQCVDAWFEGYPAGVASARKYGAGKNSDLYISKMIDTAIVQEKEGVKVASDVKVISGNGSSLPATKGAVIPSRFKSPFGASNPFSRSHPIRDGIY